MKNKPKYKICVAGAVETSGCSLDTLELAKRIGKAVAKSGHFLVTGAHHGFPMFSAMGARDKGGEVVYFSPAARHAEHVDAYRLDTDHSDMIIYTGFGYVGSDILMTRTSDAVIIGCGKLDTLHEFTLAFKEGKPVGILKGDWEVDDVIKRLVGENPGSHVPVIFEDDPEQLVRKLLELIK